MIGHEHPRVYGSARIGDDFTKTVKKPHSILVVLEDSRFVYPAHNDVVQRTGYIQPCLTWHGVNLQHSHAAYQQYFSISVITSPITHVFLKDPVALDQAVDVGRKLGDSFGALDP